MGFVGNYAPCGLSPQTDGMPVIHKNGPSYWEGPWCLYYLNAANVMCKNLNMISAPFVCLVLFALSDIIIRLLTLIVNTQFV